MSELMYREFSISTVPEEKQVEDCGRMRTRIETTITITEIKTGKVFTHVTPNRFSERGIENIIMKNFPASNTSRSLRNTRNYAIVTLTDDLSADNICGNMHTALRKLCDSKASSYWWNLIHYLPSGIMGYVWEITSRHLKGMPKQDKLCNYAKVIRGAWHEAFDRLQYAVMEWDRHNRINADELSIDKKVFEDLFEDMTHKQFEAYKQAVQMAMLAVDYLDEDDFAGMMGYMYAYEKAEA